MAVGAVGNRDAAGQGQYLECKQENPEGGPRREMFKTTAAFAGQDGGTVLIGVQDDLQITGLPQGWIRGPSGDTRG